MQKVTTWDQNAIALLKAVYASPSDAKRLFADPQPTAAGLGFDLDPGFAAELQKLSTGAFFATDSPADEEVAAFLRATIIVDGRCPIEWLADPDGVARKLGLTVSPAVIARVKTLNANLDVKRSVGSTDREYAAKTYHLLCVAIASKGPEHRPVEPSYLDRF